MNHMTIDIMRVVPDLPRMSINLPEAHIERAEIDLPSVVPGVAPRPWIGPEPYFVTDLPDMGPRPSDYDDRAMGPYRIQGVNPHWIDKIEGRGLTWLQPFTNLPQNVPTSPTTPWRVSMVRPPARFGPYSVRVHNGGVV